MKIKAARLYVKGIAKTRTFLLGALFVLFAFALLASGLFLIHMAFFAYSAWSIEVKFAVALVLGIVELIGAVSILFYLFKEETWSEFSEVPEVVKAAVDGKDRSLKG